MLRIGCVSNCSHKTEEEDVQVRIKADLYLKLVLLAQEEPDEFVLLGNIKDGYVEDKIFVPKQKRASASVKMAEATDWSGNLVIHSHPGMSAFHSRIDDEDTISAFEFSGVVSPSGMKIYRKVYLPCGNYKVSEAKLVIDASVDELRKELHSKTETHEPLQFYYPSWWQKQEKSQEQEFYKWSEDEPDKLICPKCGEKISEFYE